MLFHRADSFSILIFVAIVALVLVAFGFSVFNATRGLGLPARRLTIWTMAIIFVYLAGFSALVESKVPLFHPQTVLPVLLGFTMLFSVALALSPVGGWLARGLPIEALVIFHAFRLPLELVLHSWVQQGTIPDTMTWSGQNLDIVSGVLALVTFKFAGRSLKVAWAFNLIGWVLLMNVIRVAIMSSPLPFAWGVQPSLMLAFYLPYALIVPVCVGGALVGHLVLFRRLLLYRSGSSNHRNNS